MTEFTIIPDNEIPERRRGNGPTHKPNPLDVELAAFLKANPRKWVEYPAATFWPYLDQMDDKDFRKMQIYVMNKMTQGRSTKARSRTGGAFVAAPEEGRFMTRTDRAKRRVLVSFSPAESR